MPDNPYQSPADDPPYQSPADDPSDADAARPKHRSFRLTPETSPGTALVVVGTMRDALIFAVIQQVPLLVLGALILDGGQIFRLIAIATTAFWVMALLILFRRFGRATNSDILLVKWGIWPLLLITCLLGVAYSAFHFVP